MSATRFRALVHLTAVFLFAALMQSPAQSIAAPPVPKPQKWFSTPSGISLRVREQTPRERLLNRVAETYIWPVNLRIPENAVGILGYEITLHTGGKEQILAQGNLNCSQKGEETEWYIGLRSASYGEGYFTEPRAKQLILFVHNGGARQWQAIERPFFDEGVTTWRDGDDTVVLDDGSIILRAADRKGEDSRKFAARPTRADLASPDKQYLFLRFHFDAPAKPDPKTR